MYSETLDLCTAVQPALPARELVRALDILKFRSPNRSNFASSRPPSAGRAVEDAGWKFRELYSHVFGLASAVINYCRFSSLMQAICRRCLAIMYVDHVTVQDLASARGYGQRSMCELFALKAKDVALQQDFCCPEHGRSETFTTGCVRLRPRALAPALCSKVVGILGSFLQKLMARWAEDASMLCVSACTPMSNPSASATTCAVLLCTSPKCSR